MALRAGIQHASTPIPSSSNGTATKVTGSYALTPPQLAGDRFRERQAHRQPNQHSESHEPQSRSNHHPLNIAAFGSQCHANANFVGSSRIMQLSLRSDQQGVVETHASRFDLEAFSENL